MKTGRSDQASHETTRLHEGQTRADEPAPDQNLGCSRPVLRVQTVGPVDVIGMHDKVVDYDEAVQP